MIEYQEDQSGRAALRDPSEPIIVRHLFAKQLPAMRKEIGMGCVRDTAWMDGLRTIAFSAVAQRAVKGCGAEGRKGGNKPGMKRGSGKEGSTGWGMEHGQPRDRSVSLGAVPEYPAGFVASGYGPRLGLSPAPAILVIDCASAGTRSEQPYSREVSRVAGDVSVGGLDPALHS